jgi:hypothetical protein
VNTFGVAGVGAMRETTKVVRSKSFLLSDLVLFDTSKQFLSSLICGESVLSVLAHVHDMGVG